MPIVRFKSCRALLLCALLSVVATVPARAQTQVQPGFNLFSPAQDIEIGRQSAQKVEQQMPMLTQPAISRYVSALGARLASYAPGAKFPYQFKVVNVASVNAFALPGGYIYVHRGLLEKVHTEGELAGVMAHEIAHVALRHPTNQASKAYLAQAGLGILGGLLGGRSQNSSGQVISAVGGLGMNALFLRFSRSVETQADIVGAQIMSRAGYDPMEMVNFFEVLRVQAGSDPSKFAQFLSDHPAPVDRQARVRQEAALLGPIHHSVPVGSVASLQADLGRLSPAPTTAQAQAQAQAQGGTESPTVQPDESPAGSSTASIGQPASGLSTYRQRQGLYQIQYPSNWVAYPGTQGYSVTIAPRGGLVQGSNGRQSLAAGVVVSHYVPFDGAVGNEYRDPEGSLFGSSPLEEATSDLVRHLVRANPGLNPVAGSEKLQSSAGAPTFSVQLAGASSAGGDPERVSVYARTLPDAHVIYVLVVGRTSNYDQLAPATDRMVRSLRIVRNASH